jgi:hypothetical protein
VIRRAWAWLVAGPDYPAVGRDRRTVDVAGLRVPLRASVAVGLTTVVLLVDGSRVLAPEILAAGRSPDALRAIAVERAVLFGLMPLAVVLFAFRDAPSRYGLTLGDWRAGSALLLVGLALMTPIVVWAASLDEVRTYYAPGAEPLPELVLTNTLDLAAAEFLFRGFLMMTLLRAVGPIAILLAIMPFAFAHIGKPALELLSTPLGGFVYGWLAWRTGSIVWGTVGHVAILCLVTMAAAGTS